MSNLTNFNDGSHSIENLIDSWISQENSGNQFPVPFDFAWQLAGYNRKSTGKRDGLRGLKEGRHFCTEKCKSSGGRDLEFIRLSIESFKHMCLIANTEEGEQIKDYFIECEKKWKLVQQHSPKVAEDIEVLHMKIELAKLEASKALAEQKTVELRHYVVTSLPKPLGDRILGVTEVKEIEYRDRIIKDE